MTESRRLLNNLGAIAGVAGILAVFSAIFFQGWIRARLAPDPSSERRLAWFERAAAQGMPARTAAGVWTRLRREDIARVTPASCSRTYSCSRHGRVNCTTVLTTYVCAFDLTDRAGGTATAALLAYPNVLHDPASPSEWQRDTHIERALEWREAGGALSDLGYSSASPPHGR